MLQNAVIQKKVGEKEVVRDIRRGSRSISEKVMEPIYEPVEPWLVNVHLHLGVGPAGDDAGPHFETLSLDIEAAKKLRTKLDAGIAALQSAMKKGDAPGVAHQTWTTPF